MSSPYRGLAPYLYYADATAALAWLTRVFGFTEEVRFCDGAGEVFQATLRAGDARIQIAGVGPDYWQAKGVDGPVGQLNILYVDDVDEALRAGRGGPRRRGRARPAAGPALRRPGVHRRRSRRQQLDVLAADVRHRRAAAGLAGGPRGR